MLRQNGLALGGSLDNAIVIGETGVLQRAALRRRVRPPQDPGRDRRSGAGRAIPIIGHVVAHRGGHALHTAFAAQDPGGDRRVAAGRDAGEPERGAVAGAASRRTSLDDKARGSSRRAVRPPGRKTALSSARRLNVTHPERSCRRRRSAALEPIDPFTHQVELDAVASRRLGHGDFDAHVCLAPASTLWGSQARA